MSADRPGPSEALVRSRRASYMPRTATATAALSEKSIRHVTCTVSSTLTGSCLTESSGDVAAVVTEPYLGGGGYVVPPPGYPEVAIRAFCDKHGLLLIYDEVQSSFGRTGKMFAFENFNLIPIFSAWRRGSPAASLLRR